MRKLLLRTLHPVLADAGTCYDLYTLPSVPLMLKKAPIIAFLLTAVTWVIVDVTEPKAPLDKTDTAVVFAIWFGLALLALWGWKQVRSRSQHAANKK